MSYMSKSFISLDNIAVYMIYHFNLIEDLIFSYKLQSNKSIYSFSYELHVKKALYHWSPY
jgi:hypothetical protein